MGALHPPRGGLRAPGGALRAPQGRFLAWQTGADPLSDIIISLKGASFPLDLRAPAGKASIDAFRRLPHFLRVFWRTCRIPAISAAFAGSGRGHGAPHLCPRRHDHDDRHSCAARSAARGGARPPAGRGSPQRIRAGSQPALIPQFSWAPLGGLAPPQGGPSGPRGGPSGPPGALFGLANRGRSLK